MQYDKFLNYWYGENGFAKEMFGKSSDSKWNAPEAPFAEYFEPAFSAAVQAYIDRNSTVFKLLPKTTYMAEGDSWKYYDTDVTTLQSLSHASTPFADAAANSAGPELTALEHLIPSYMGTFWETSLMSATERKWMPIPKTDPAWLKQYHSEKMPNYIDAKLCNTVDSVNFDPSNDQAMFIDSIDRILSGSAEATTSFVNDATELGY